VQLAKIYVDYCVKVMFMQAISIQERLRGILQAGATEYSIIV